jgi:hypothetical protein
VFNLSLPSNKDKSLDSILVLTLASSAVEEVSVVYSTFLYSYIASYRLELSLDMPFK